MQLYAEKDRNGVPVIKKEQERRSGAFRLETNPGSYYYYYYYYANQHKAAGRKIRVDMKNYGCNGNLLCYHGVVERNRISSLQSHGKALEKECCLPDV